MSKKYIFEDGVKILYHCATHLIQDGCKKLMAMTLKHYVAYVEKYLISSNMGHQV